MKIADPVKPCIDPRPLEFRLTDPPQIDVDGYIDARGIRYIGKATQQFDGTWRCLAGIGTGLCLVEVKITGRPCFYVGAVVDSR